MNSHCKLSNVTQDYLSVFYSILEEMIQGMTEAVLSDSISYNFIVQMIPHHLAAIEMSRNLLRFTTNIPLQNIAENIITEQTNSIQNMQEILCTCENFQNHDKHLCTYQENTERILQTMFCEMKQACSVNNVNASFMYEMIPHHRGAVRMSENALKYNICPGLEPILCSIIRSQKRGIREMEQLLRWIR